VAQLDCSTCATLRCSTFTSGATRPAHVQSIPITAGRDALMGEVATALGLNTSKRERGPPTPTGKEKEEDGLSEGP
jgi:hypothetical protein